MSLTAIVDGTQCRYDSRDIYQEGEVETYSQSKVNNRNIETQTVQVLLHRHLSFWMSYDQSRRPLLTGRNVASTAEAFAVKAGQKP